MLKSSLLLLVFGWGIGNVSASPLKVDFRNGLKYSVQADFAGQVPEKGYYKTKGWGVMHTVRSSMQIVYPDGTVVDVSLIDPVYTQKFGRGIW